MAERQVGDDRLDSWKEIAAYLKRNERTVSRWEKRGLPVYRVPGAQRQMVFAYKHELDEWMKRGKANNGAPTLEQGTATVIESSEPPPVEKEAAQSEQNTDRAIRRKKWGLVALGGYALVFMGIVGGFLTYSHMSRSVRPFHLVKLTDDGHVKSSLRTDGATLYFNELEMNRWILKSSPIGRGPVRTIETPLSNVQVLDISNDGRNLLVTSFAGLEQEPPLWIIPTMGGSPRRVGDVLCDFAQWSPDNRRIACISGTRIIVLNADGLDAHIVRSFSSHAVRLVWSPDGNRLRVVLQEAATGTLTAWEIGITDDNSAGQPAAAKLPLGNDCCGDWTWTREGRNFAYLQYGASGRTRLLLKPEGGWLSTWFARDAELPVQIGNVEALTSSKTNDSLYLLIDNVLPEHSYRAELLKFDVGQGALKPWLQGLSAHYVSFSRDGRWMTYVSTLDSSLWRSRVDSTEAFQLTKPSIEVALSAWSPDGRRIAFMGKQPGKPWRIFLIGRDGGALQEAALGDDNQGAPTWSPDGKALVYGNVDCKDTLTCWIRRVDLGTQTVEIVPGSRGFRTARWSPDGKYIAALQPGTQQLMLFDVSAGRWTTLADSISGDNINWSSDSQFIYTDSPQTGRPVIERTRIKDGQRVTVISLTSLQEVPGQLSTWFGLAPDNSPILMHQFTAREVYALEWMK